MKKSNIVLIIVLLVYFAIIFIVVFKTRNLLKPGILRFLSIKFPKKSRENYAVKEKINYDPNCPFIVSCSLFGDMQDPQKYSRYLAPLLENGKKIKKIYPGSNLRIYIPPDLLASAKQKLVDEGFEVHVMNLPSRGLSGTFWRFIALEDKTPEAIVFISDADTPFHQHLSAKGLDVKKIIDEWVETPVKFLIIGSNLVYVPCSANRIVMKNHVIEGMTDKINKYEGEVYGEDEVFSKREIWPIINKEGYKRIFIFKETAIVVGVTLGIIMSVFIPFFLIKYVKRNKQYVI